MNSLHRLLIVLLAAVPAPLSAQACNSADRAVAIILDASGSMNARLAGGETRWAAAQRAVKGVAGLVPGKAQLSLRMYGAQSAASKKDCEDTYLAVPFGAAEALGDAIVRAADGAKAQGYTPIAYSLEKAAADFPPGAKQRVIVLVSDGKETCKGDPVLTARALAAKGITIHAIGFVVDSAAKMQLQGVARASGGSYFDAPQGSELGDTLKAAINACKGKAPEVPTSSSNPGKLRTASSQWLSEHEVINAETGQKAGALNSSRLEIPLPPGVYEVKFGPATWKGIEVRAGETTTISPAVLKVAKSVNARIVDAETGAEHERFNAVLSSATLMPGVYDLVFVGGLRWPFLKLDGGETLTIDPVEIKLGQGKWKKARILHEGKPVASFDAVTHRYTLPPGDYVVEVDGRLHPISAPKGGGSFEIRP